MRGLKSKGYLFGRSDDKKLSIQFDNPTKFFNVYLHLKVQKKFGTKFDFLLHAHRQPQKHGSYYKGPFHKAYVMIHACNDHGPVIPTVHVVLVDMVVTRM